MRAGTGGGCRLRTVGTQSPGAGRASIELGGGGTQTLCLRRTDSMERMLRCDGDGFRLARSCGVAASAFAPGDAFAYGPRGEEPTDARAYVPEDCTGGAEAGRARNEPRVEYERAAGCRGRTAMDGRLLYDGRLRYALRAEFACAVGGADAGGAWLWLRGGRGRSDAERERASLYVACGDAEEASDGRGMSDLRCGDVALAAVARRLPERERVRPRGGAKTECSSSAPSLGRARPLGEDGEVCRPEWNRCAALLMVGLPVGLAELERGKTLLSGGAGRNMKDSYVSSLRVAISPARQARMGTPLRTEELCALRMGDHMGNCALARALEDYQNATGRHAQVCERTSGGCGDVRWLACSICNKLVLLLVRNC